MEECRYETSELQASFMMSTPLWSDSWTLCHAANCARSVQIQNIAGIIYVALPPVIKMTELGDLVGLEVIKNGNFSGLSASLASDEPPPMVDAALLKHLESSLLLVHSQVCFLFAKSFFFVFLVLIQCFYFFYPEYNYYFIISHTIEFQLVR